MHNAQIKNRKTFLLVGEINADKKKIKRGKKGFKKIKDGDEKWKKEKN